MFQRFTTAVKKLKHPVLEYTRGSPRINHPDSHPFFHEAQRFFEIFEITG